ncbi:hypothetical protein BJ742DRAFT_808832 [Cladochytrium replicatum]|nr:hypothetical protein BJ742DRAFT_808832 [Cladochytrium replicatum]
MFKLDNLPFEIIQGPICRHLTWTQILKLSQVCRVIRSATIPLIFGRISFLIGRSGWTTLFRSTFAERPELMKHVRDITIHEPHEDFFEAHHEPKLEEVEDILITLAPNLQRVSLLLDHRLSYAGMEALCTFFRSLSCEASYLQSLEVSAVVRSSSSFHDDVVADLGTSLKTLNKLSSLQLRISHLTKDTKAWEAFSEGLLMRIDSIDQFDWTFRGSHCNQLIAEYLVRATALKDVCLTFIEEGVVNAFRSALPAIYENGQALLRSLKLTLANLESDNGILLTDGLSRSRSLSCLKSLSLVDCRFDQPGVDRLARCVSESKTLLSIEISGFCKSPLSAGVLAAAVARSTNVRVIGLGGPILDDLTLELFTKYVCDASNLREVHITKAVRCRSMGFTSLIKKISECDTISQRIRKLVLDHNNLDDDFWSALKDLVAVAPSLRLISLERCRIASSYHMRETLEFIANVKRSEKRTVDLVL